MVGYSLIALLYKTVQHIKRTRNSTLYEPIIKGNQPSNYGSIADQMEDDDTSSSNTIVPLELKPRSWSAFDWIRCLLSVIQLYLVIQITLFTRNNDKTIEVPIEGAFRDLIRMYYTRVLFWVSS